MKKVTIILMALLVVAACKEQSASKDPEPQDQEAEDSVPVAAVLDPNVTITLTVDDKLFEITDPTLEDIETYSELVDDNKNFTPVTENFKDFETAVKPGQIVRWKAETKSSDKGFSIAIDNIVNADAKEYDLDMTLRANFFNRMVICSNNGKFVQEKVRENISEGKELWYSYWINFSIQDKDSTIKHYSIDPRLKVH